MKRFLPEQLTCWSLTAGLLLALAFPRVDLEWLAWIALTPLLLVMDARPFRSGFTAGVGFFGLVLYWLNIVMTTYGGLHPLLSLVAYLLLVGYLALFFGIATWACCRLREKLRLSPVLTLPVLWTALEFVRSFLLTGFPWALLGYSQQKQTLLLQSADLFGVFGLSFLLVLSNTLCAEVWRAWCTRNPAALPRFGLLAGLLLATGVYAYGTWRLAQNDDSAGKALDVAMVQGNIDQSLKWDPAFQQATVDRYRNLSLAEARNGHLDLIVWPESATPFYFQEPGLLSEEVRSVPRAASSYLLFGSPAYAQVNRQIVYLNSAFLLDQRGATLGRSDKVHLVPFGEYVPLATFLPFIDKLVVGIGDFSPGLVNPLPMNGERLGVLVCFEGIFPELARDYVRKGSELLVNITNDAWFGRSSAPYQHLAMIRFRAVENRIWLVRAANTGISAIIDPHGRIAGQTEIFTTTVLRGRVRLGASRTVYNRFGDILPMGCLAVSVLWLIGTRRRFNGKRNELGA